MSFSQSGASNGEQAPEDKQCLLTAALGAPDSAQHMLVLKDSEMRGQAGGRGFSSRECLSFQPVLAQLG